MTAAPRIKDGTGGCVDRVGLSLPAVSFLEYCEITSVSLVCRKVGQVLADPAHIGKIRGALGEVLRESASAAVRAGRECDWVPPCAYQMLWRSPGELRPGKAMPAPYVLETDALGRDLRVSLTLVGFAGDYLGEVGDALVRALRRGLSGPERMVLEPEQRQFHERLGLPDSGIRHQARLDFVTPLLIRNSNEGAHIEPGAVLRSMIHRGDAFARWCGVELDADFPALLEATKRVEGAWAGVDVQEWKRGAVQQQRIVPMEGALGRLHLRGDLAPFAPFIAMAQVYHCGARTAWGLGRFRVSHAC